ncbi:Legionella vir homologue protein [Candidatus Rickettsiella viridis]|uniref:Legionella vir homologue protein n=1 Tax=Candidatus Rickettsiella viridis TaxID=676208 RepID=A0A2Z5UTK4_9COXI|nr:type IV secretion system protein [Candidatus Rickettsiella viridis]BBB14778.1 type IV secretory systen protein VirB6 [Candidatus Rickettsiella viridis]BBB15508.1 Legionella vir homologue protein [Candidatus Rickettsiella viridis]
MSTLSVNTFITDTLSAVDQTIEGFVHNVYQQFLQQYGYALTLLCTVYILVLGYRFTLHTLSADFNTLNRHILVLLMVYGLIINWSLYQLFIYNIFTNEPNHIAQIIVNASNHQFTTDKTIAEALNQVYGIGMSAAGKLLSSFTIQKFLCAILVIIFTFLCSLTALALLIYAKLAMAIGLALGPLFLPFMLWESTRGWFVSWLQKLFNFSLIPIITASILSLMLSLINLVLPDLNQQALQGAPDFFTVGLFGGLSLVTAFLLKQSLSIASSLSGGLTLSALGQIGSMVKSALNTTGVNSAARLTGKGLKSAGSAMVKKAQGQKQSAIHSAVEQGKNN